jgi:hypothetical protein
MHDQETQSIYSSAAIYLSCAALLIGGDLPTFLEYATVPEKHHVVQNMVFSQNT